MRPPSRYRQPRELGWLGPGRKPNAKGYAWPPQRSGRASHCYATHDLETTLAAAAHTTPGPRLTQVLILSGTGSCCYGNNPAGLTAKVGGWGHVLGDQGSGYEIGLDA